MGPGAIEWGAPLGLLALISVPLTLVLYMLRPRRRTVPVSSSRLWREALRERRHGQGFARLLRDLSLLLVLLAVLCLSLALADPRWLTRGALDYDAVIVVDTSASMQTDDGNGARFEKARDAALALIAETPDTARTLVMTSARRPTLRSAFESDKQALLRVVRDLRVTDSAGRPGLALTLAHALLSDRERGRVVFVTDGAHVPLAGLAAERVRVIRVADAASAADNVAITRFDVRAEVGAERRFQVLIRVHNHGRTAASVPLELTLGERRLHAETLQLAPETGATLVLPFEGTPVGRAVASIDVADALAVDNRAYAVATAAEALLIALVSNGNYYVESALGALPNVVLNRLAPAEAAGLIDSGSAYDVVVFDGLTLPRLPPGASLLIDSVGAPLPLESIGREQRPEPSGRGASALLAGIDLSALSIEEARRVRVLGSGAGLQRLFWSERTELAAAWLGEQRRVVYLGFDPGRSSFPLQAGFPLFLAQALEWLVPRGLQSAAPEVGNTQVAAGEPLAAPAPRGVPQVILRTPDGGAERLAVVGGQWRYERTERAGFYRYEAGLEVRDLAVNLTNEAESDVRPGAPAGLPAATGEAPAAPLVAEGQVALPLWPFLALLAMAALTVEWSLRCARLA